MEKKCRVNEELVDNADNSNIVFDFSHLSNIFFERKNHFNLSNIGEEKELYASPSEVIFESNCVKSIIDTNKSNSVIHFIAPLQDHNRLVLNQKIKSLLSLAYNVGAHRFNQACNDLIKAYTAGISLDDLDEISDMFVHYQKIGETVSEIGPWPIFDAYQKIREFEQKGLPKEEIIQYLNNRFNDKIISKV
jgi:hypothetical protein